MARQTENKIILITRETRLKELIRRFNSLNQAKFYIEHNGIEFDDYQEEDAKYEDSLSAITKILSDIGRLQIIDRSFLTNFVFGKKDVIVALGQDGLVVNTAKYLEDQILIGVNPDPQRWNGILLPFNQDNVGYIIDKIFNNTAITQQVTMAKVELNDGQKLYAINDLFIGTKGHCSARYSLKIGSIEEIQSSSGVIISTGLGATGWLSSIITGAKGIVSFLLNEKDIPFNELNTSWDMDSLFYSIREPFPSVNTSTNLIFGEIYKDNPITITSLMPENGIIFSDGIENDYIEFNSGATATISIAERKVNLAVG